MIIDIIYGQPSFLLNKLFHSFRDLNNTLRVIFDQQQKRAFIITTCVHHMTSYQWITGQNNRTYVRKVENFILIPDLTLVNVTEIRKFFKRHLGYSTWSGRNFMWSYLSIQRECWETLRIRNIINPFRHYSLCIFCHCVYPWHYNYLLYLP